YFQVTTPSSDFSFVTEAFTIDSAFIILPYSGLSWGDTTDSYIQTFTAYEFTESLGKDDHIYNNQEKSFNPTPISEPLQIDLRDVARNDSVLLNGVNRPKHIRIKLNNATIQRFAAASGT